MRRLGGSPLIAVMFVAPGTAELTFRALQPSDRTVVDRAGGAESKVFLPCGPTWPILGSLECPIEVCSARAALPQDREERIREDMATLGFEGPYIPDPEGRIGAHLQAKVSTETFVIDAAHTLRYRGAVDDQFGIRYN